MLVADGVVLVAALGEGIDGKLKIWMNALETVCTYVGIKQSIMSV